LVYQYFKGKEDLLFSIAHQKIEKAIELLDDQLEGIIDPVSKLSKMIWFSLKYNEKYSDYAAIMIFECHSNLNFYESSAHRLCQDYLKRLEDLLIQGTAEGTFRNDVDIQVLKDIVSGIIGAEIFDSLIRGKGRGSRDLQDIMELLLPMVVEKEGFEENNKANRILSAAEKVFSECGFAGAKISDIARMARVAEGTIYEYFKNKEDLLLSLPLKRFEKHLEMMDLLLFPNTPLDRMKRYLKSYIELFLGDVDFLKVFLLNIILNPRFYETESFKIYSKYTRVMDDIINDGKRDKSFRQNVNTQIFKRFFFGGFHYMAIRWFVTGKQDRYDKMVEVNHLILLLTSAILQPERVPADKR